MKHLLLALACCAIAPSLAAQKLKVYVLVGQSNMQGHAKTSTFAHLANDPATAPLLKQMQRDDGTPIERDDVWISYLSAGRDAVDHEVSGKLTAGFGARSNVRRSDDKIGPELTFGIRVGDAHEEPVLLIKTAWGGKSLHTDFRPPSAGAFEFSEEQLARFAKQGKDVAKLQADKAKATGHYYRLMIEHVKRVLEDPRKVYPKYDRKRGFELAGMVWFQGWNDMVDRGIYPQRDQPGGYAAYSECLAHFIRDVRKDLDAPDLPFVIGVMGVGGPIAERDKQRRRVHANFWKAMAQPASLPEFRGNVTAVATAPFWDAELQAIADKQDKVRHLARMLRTKNKNHANKDGSMSKQQQREHVDAYRSELLTQKELRTWEQGASNAAYHYLGCAKTMAQIGVAFADAALALHDAR